MYKVLPEFTFENQFGEEMGSAHPKGKIWVANSSSLVASRFVRFSRIKCESCSREPSKSLTPRTW